MKHSFSSALFAGTMAIGAVFGVNTVSATQSAGEAGFECAVSSASQRSGTPASKAAEKSPPAPDPDVFHESGVRKVKAGDLEGAIADFTMAITLDPRNIAGYNNRAHVRALQGNPDAAIADYSRAIALKPDDSSAYSDRGEVKVMKGDLKGALADSDKAVSLRPDDAQARAARGCVRYLTGDLKGAMADLDFALKINPDRKSVV